MGLYERIRDVAKEKGYSINQLEKDLGFARSSINKFNKNTPSTDKIQKIADQLDVTIDYLITGQKDDSVIQTCPDCGLTYCTDCLDDINYHQQEHSAWQKAEEKYGEIYGGYVKRERIKAENRNIANNKSLPLKERYDAQVLVLRCLYSRSISNNHYSLAHTSFEKYVAMMLNNEIYRNSMDCELYEELKKNYGILPGVDNGSTYYTPSSAPVSQIIDTSFTEDEFTKEEIDEIHRFAEFIKQRRK